MTRDYSQHGDPYGISEYSNQSADTINPSPKHTRPDGDVRGNTQMVARGIPTQAEADAVMRGEVL